MDFSAQQQQQYQSWQLQSQSYDPYTYHYHHPHQPYYYQQPNAHLQHQQQHGQPIHPPGVPDPSSTGLPVQSQESAYQHPAHQLSTGPSAAAAATATTMTYLTPGLQQGHQWYSQPDAYAPLVGGPGLALGHGSQPYMIHPSAASQAPRKFGNRRGGTPFRGGRQGKPSRGRGSSQGRGGSTPSSSNTEASAVNNQQPKVAARCDVCNADCTSLDVLEQHKLGKRHLKNMKKLDPLKNTFVSEVQNGKSVAANDLVVGSLPSQNVESQAALESTDKKEGEPEKPVVLPIEAAKVNDLRRGSKRAIRGGGRGGKRVRISGRPERGPHKPKVVIPLVCDLCNVKCDTQEVLDRHLAGKKHISKRKHFEAHQAMYGPQELQVLYPPNPVTQTLLQSQQQQQPQQPISVPPQTPSEQPSAAIAAASSLPSQTQTTVP
ncbi:unnamed protein product [Cuscuta epithymum]|uniref:C2H2-type domain-containing protein n=1 Tax=Cuscuta epithymum TaxID=186058 RepID=A0AAV0CQE9_9ASTE|nr:unnamed protein product [Cuscuta epithymum]